MAESPPPSLFCSVGSETTSLSDDDLRTHIDSFLDTVGGPQRKEVLILPPDFTRFHSQAGKLTRMICEYYGFIPPSSSSSSSSTSPPSEKKPKLEESSSCCPTKIEILPALGTHAPMTPEEIRKMFGDELANRQESGGGCGSGSGGGPFLVHDWRNDVVTIGEVPASMVKAATRGMVDEPWPAQLNRVVWDKRLPLQHEDDDPPAAAAAAAAAASPPQQHQKPKKALVLSIGQVVPHEVMGMANFNKNLFVGTGGVEAINLSHFIGAVHGMERMMGRKDNPLRDILNYASERYLESELDLWYVLTVVSPDAKAGGGLCVRGLYIGRDAQCYSDACDLSLKVNFTLLERPVSRMVTYLDQDEFRSTWLGNKAIYRTRMAMADGGELVILAPGVSRFGEDPRVDELIRKYGYRGTPATMKAMDENEELQENLSAVAHLIHGSSEGRFRVTYCPGHLTREEVEAAGFEYGDLAAMSQRYDVEKLQDGWQSDRGGDGDGDGGEYFFIRNPALGLWAVRSRFETSD